jgi:hypothetical protein
MRHANIAGYNYGSRAIVLVRLADAIYNTYSEWRKLDVMSTYENQDQDRAREMDRLSDEAGEQIATYRQVLGELDRQARFALADTRSRWKVWRTTGQSK